MHSVYEVLNTSRVPSYCLYVIGYHIIIIIIIIIIIRFRQCQGNYRCSVAYRDNYPFINMISFIIDKNNK